MSSRVGLRDNIREYLTKRGFQQPSFHYFKYKAPGILAHWTEVVVDIRFLTQDRMTVFGVRDSHSAPEILFQGDVDTMTEFVTIMKCTKAIEYGKDYTK